MTQRSKHSDQAINWEEYEGYQLYTADSVLVGAITGVVREPADGDLYLAVDSTASPFNVYRVSVDTVGIVSNSRLLLDALASEFDYLRASDKDSEPDSRNGEMNGHGSESPSSMAVFSEERSRSYRRERYYQDSFVLGPRIIDSDAQRPIQMSTDPGALDPDVDDNQSKPSSQHHSLSTANLSTQSRSVQRRLEIAVTQIHERNSDDQRGLLRSLQRRTEVLEQLMLDMYLRHSPSDVANALENIHAPRINMLPQSVDGDSDEMAEGFDEFSERDLSEITVVYLFVNSVYGSLRKQAGLTEDCLATWAICSDGRQVLVHLSPGERDSLSSWSAHFQSLVDRGLPAPFMVTTDSTLALNQAVGEAWPEAKRVRCWMDKMARVMDEAPSTIRPSLKLWLQSIRDAPDYEQGERLATNMIDKFSSRYPDAIEEFSEDLSASLTHLTTPVAHRRIVRNADLGEQSLLNDQSRRALLFRMQFDSNCLKAVFEMLNRSPQLWRGVRFTEAERLYLGLS